MVAKYPLLHDPESGWKVGGCWRPPPPPPCSLQKNPRAGSGWLCCHGRWFEQLLENTMKHDHTEGEGEGLANA